MRKTLTGIALLTVAVGGFTGCAASTPDDGSTKPYVEEDGAEPRVREKEDANSKLVISENSVATYTVKLNNGATVECVEISGDLECFPETLQER